jgi:hypothetical protein
MKSALLGRNHIWVNGKIFFSAPSQEDQLAITELIKSIVEQARKEASPMNPQSSPTIPNVFADFHSSLPPELDDANFESNVYSDNKLHLIYFYWQSQIKEAAAITNELYLSRRYSSKYTISKMNLANNPLTHEKLGFSIAPTIAVFKDKQVICEVSGESVKWNIVVTHLNSLIEQYSRVKGTETLDNLTSKLARKSEKRRIFGKVERWEFALISGLVSGVVLAFVRSKLEGGIAFLVVALAYGIFILRLNFTVLQRLFATALMLSVGFYWREIIDALRKLLN